MDKFYTFECTATKVIVVEAESQEQAMEFADEWFTDSSDWEPVEMDGGRETTEADARSEIRHGAVNATDSIGRRGE